MLSDSYNLSTAIVTVCFLTVSILQYASSQLQSNMYFNNYARCAQTHLLRDKIYTSEHVR